MIVDENITVYMHSLEADLPEELEELREYAQQTKVPIIRREMEPLIRVLLRIARPDSILEIGTGIGYSALFMHHCRESAAILTIENYEPRLALARRNLEGISKIRLLEGDACGILSGLEGTFDMIFLDAAKAQYITMLPDILRLMHPGSILLADNVLQDGDLVRSRYALPRRQRTIHERMRQFIWETRHCPELDASLVTQGDGIILAVKRQESDETAKR